MSAGVPKSSKSEFILTFCWLFVLVLAVSVFRTVSDSGINSISISLPIPVVLRVGHTHKKVDGVWKPVCKRISVRLESGSYLTENLRDEVIKLSNVALHNSSTKGESVVDTVCDLYLVEGSGMTLTTEGTGNIRRKKPYLILDTDHDDLPIAMCMIRNTEDENACEAALIDYIKRGKSALVGDTEARTNSILPSSVAKPLEHTTLTLNFIEGVDDAHTRSLDGKQTFVVEHARAALLALERAGGLPSGATVNVRSYAASTVHAREGLLACGASHAHTRDGMEITVDLRAAMMPSSEVQVWRCPEGSKTVVTGVQTESSSGSGSGGDAINTITKEVLSAIRAWALLEPYSPQLPSPGFKVNRVNVGEGEGEGEGEDAVDSGTVTMMLVQRARHGGIHPWELPSWREAAAGRLWRLLGASLPALASSLSPPSTQGLEGLGLARTGEHLLENTNLQAAFRSSLGQTVETARRLQKHLQRLSQLPYAGGGNYAGILSADSFSHLIRANELCLQLLYDPALLATLHFPLEQQASIYAPFWIPVFAPIVKALLALFR